jgi:hypothetical protein
MASGITVVRAGLVTQAVAGKAGRSPGVEAIAE